MDWTHARHGRPRPHTVPTWAASVSADLVSPHIATHRSSTELVTGQGSGPTVGQPSIEGPNGMPLFGTAPSRVDVTDQLGDMDMLGPPDRDLRVLDFTCPEMCRESYEAIKDDTMAQLRFKRDVVEAVCIVRYLRVPRCLSFRRLSRSLAPDMVIGAHGLDICIRRSQPRPRTVPTWGRERLR